MRLGSVVAASLVLLGTAFLVANCVSFTTQVRRPPPDPADVLVDDRLADKKPQPFDGSRVYDVPCGEDGAWVENRSAAVIRLDVPMVRADTQRDQLVLHASYAEAAAAQPHHEHLLPSINAIDGKAKQFDDGLVAALDIACFDGLPEAAGRGKLVGRVEIVRRLADAVGEASAAAPFLAAALELAGCPLARADSTAVRALLEAFAASADSEPIAFYTWSEQLERVFRFTRFLQRPHQPGTFPGAADVQAALTSDPTLREAYARTVGIDQGVHNPAQCASLLALGDGKSVVAVLPPVSSREVELCRGMLEFGPLPAGTNLMTELVRRIRAGEVDLTPRPDGGWLDRQVYALETLLLPERADERDHLLLTKAYKKRMLEAFQALLVKRLESHALPVLGSAAPAPPVSLPPTLRVEPCATYALRTARAYAFLEAFLVSTLGADTLATLHGRREGGVRETDLLSELRRMRDLFYGIHLVSAADVGMDPTIADDEPVDRDACRAAALAWLSQAYADPDLAADTRVCVTFATDSQTRVWATVGVRLTRLEVSWARPPRMRPADGSGDWRAAPGGDIVYALPVDDFAELTLTGRRSLTRAELRALCGNGRTRAEILAAIE